jgi:DNA repair protein RadD
MASNLPQFQIYKVTNTIYTRHVKKDRPDSILITTYCGLNNKFKTFMCLEHGGTVRKAAYKLWDARCKYPAPETVQEALDYIHHLKVPTHIKVWINKRYPEIMLYSFTGGEDLE